MTMNTAELIALIGRMSDKISEQKDYLTELDRPIGDNDHGVNMARGFKEAVLKLETMKDKDAGTILKTTGMTIVSKAAGSSGPLYGTAFMNAGKLMTGKMEISLEDYISMMETAVDGVKMRGKATTGEKTMLDAMVPYLEKIREAKASGKDTKEILTEGYEAAYEGMKSTIPMIATKGRASYVGERSIGHQDPGATSFTFLMEVIKDFR